MHGTLRHGIGLRFVALTVGLICATTAGASSPPSVCCSEEFRELQREAPAPWVMGASSYALGTNAAIAFASLDADERSLGEELASYTVRIVPRRLDDRRTGIALQWHCRF